MKRIVRVTDQAERARRIAERAHAGDQMAARAYQRAATVFCTALNELYAALGVTTQAEALQRIADLRLHEGH